MKMTKRDMYLPNEEHLLERIEDLEGKNKELETRVQQLEAALRRKE
jgi:hypothetical protein